MQGFISAPPGGPVTSVNAGNIVTLLDVSGNRLMRAPDFTGNAKDGVVALLGAGDVVAYCIDPAKGPWCILKIATTATTLQASPEPEAEAAETV